MLVGSKGPTAKNMVGIIALKKANAAMFGHRSNIVANWVKDS